MKYFVGSVLALSLVLAPIIVTVEWKPSDAATLPWKTFSESVQDTMNAATGMCSGGQDVMVVMLEKGDVTYKYWYAPESGRVVFATFDSNGKPQEIGYGKVGENHDIIPPLTWAKFNAEKHSGGPCALLFPNQA